MDQLKRGKYARRVDHYSNSGFAGIVATSEFTTAEHKKMFIARELVRLRRAEDYRQRDIKRRGYA